MKEITEEEKESICKDYCEVGVEKLCSKYSRGYKTIVAILKEKGVFIPFRCKSAPSQEISSSMLADYSQGMSPKELSKKYSFDKRSIKKVLVKAGVWANFYEPRGISVEEKFRLTYKVQENGCWQWLRLCRPDHGPIFCLPKHVNTNPNKKNISARRYAWTLSGKELPDNKWLKNTCGNLRCVNPEHYRIS